MDIGNTLQSSNMVATPEQRERTHYYYDQQNNCKLDSSVLYKAQNMYREHLWYGSTFQRIEGTYYPFDVAKKLNMGCYTIDESGMSFSTKLVARANMPIRLNISMGKYQEASDGFGKAIHVPVKDINACVKTLSEVITRRVTNKVSMTLMINNSEKLTMESLSQDSELVSTHTYPHDMKKLSIDIADKKVDKYFKTKKDTIVKVIPSEIQAFLQSIRESLEFANLLQECEDMRQRTFLVVKEKYCTNHNRFPS